MKSTSSKRSETLEEASWSREGLNIRSLAFMVNAFAPLLITAAEVSDRPRPHSRLQLRIGCAEHSCLRSVFGVEGIPVLLRPLCHAPDYLIAAVILAGIVQVILALIGWLREGQRIFEMAPSVVVTAMTSSMPVNDLRGQGDSITPSQVTELAAGSGSGLAGCVCGRYV